MVTLFPVQTSFANTQTCIASWYGPGLHGNTMANGQKFNMNDPTTVAHKKLPLGTEVRITNLKNGKSILAIVRDRGPFVRGRCVDVSKAGAKHLGFIYNGTAPVKVETIRS